MTNPTLRFNSELCNAFPDWGVIKIKDLSEKMIGGGTPDKNNLEFWTGSVPWISSSDLSLDNINAVKITRFISDSALKNSATKLIPKGSILIVSRVGVGKVAVAPCDLCTSQDFANLINIKYDSFFLAYALIKHMGKKLNEVQGTSIKGITSREIKESSISIPCLEEQQKIASFFSTLDQKIELNERKLEVLEKLKKGMMQKIFNRKIQFKKDNGTDFPDWSSKKIGEILEIKHGKDYKNLPLGDIPVLGTGGIITYVSLFLCNWPCVLIGRKGTINKPQFMDKPFWSVDTLFYSKPKKHNSPRFQYYLFQTINWLKYSEATGVPSLSASTIENIAKSVPCLEEQEKIASFFSTLDQKIELNERKLEGLKKLKKGLMQQMFV